MLCKMAGGHVSLMYVCVCWLGLISQHIVVRGENCTDPCTKPMFCEEGDMIANPDNCETYFWCVHSAWVETSCSEADELYFDNVECVCGWEIENCALPCPTTTPRPTQLPGPCDDVPDPCVDGTLYPDQADCRYFYECIDGTLGPPVECTADLEFACLPNLPCVFDIESEVCINPDSSFNCYYRCVTSATTSSDTTMAFTSRNVTTAITTRGTPQTSTDDSTSPNTITTAFTTTTIPSDSTTTTSADSTTTSPVSFTSASSRGSTSTGVTTSDGAPTTAATASTTGDYGGGNTDGGPGAGAIVGVVVLLAAVAGAIVLFIWFRSRQATAPSNDSFSSEASAGSEMSETTNDKEKLVVSTKTGQSNMLWRSAPGTTKGVDSLEGPARPSSPQENQEFWSNKQTDSSAPNPLYGGS